MAKKTISIRLDDEDYRFLSVLAKEEREDVSKMVNVSPFQTVEK